MSMGPSRRRLAREKEKALEVVREMKQEGKDKEEGKAKEDEEEEEKDAGISESASGPELFTFGMEWLHRHQHPKVMKSGMRFEEVAHPTSDGDGFATRVSRLILRIYPMILRGDVVILTGGFRGYTHHEQGFGSVFLPFGSKPPSIVEIDEDEDDEEDEEVTGNNNWPRLPPPQMQKQKKDWWFGLLCAYFLRCNDTMREKVLAAMPSPLSLHAGTALTTMSVPTFAQCPKFIGVHLRYGDNLIGNAVPITAYIDAARYAFSAFRLNTVYVATDSSKAFGEFVDGVKDLPLTVLHQKGEKEGIKGVASVDMSAIGTSAANVLIHAEKYPALVLRATKEVLCDMTMLSYATVLIGLAKSEVTRVSLCIGISRGNVSTIALF